MPDPTEPPGAARSTRADTVGLLARRPAQAVLIGAVLAGSVAALAYVGGFLTPDRLSAKRFVDALESNAGGPHEGFRRAHAKGICIAGSFMGSPPGAALSVAAVFAGQPIPVTGRFAEAAADPFANDATTVPVRSMALRLQPAGSPEWRMAINDTPGLNVSTPEAFFDNVRASTPDPATGKPDPAKMKAFLDAHPETVAFFDRMKKRPLASGFADDSYNSIDGFIFVGADGTRRLVRWSMQAEEPFASLTHEELASRTPNYLFDDLLARVAHGPVKWRMIVTVANPGDPNRAAEVWPDDRQQVDVGELTIVHVESERAGNCQDLNFDPLVLPPGVEASDDPIPLARSAVYAASFRRRSGETKPPSAVANQNAGASP